MKRRDFIAALGGAAAMPLAARAQQPAVPVIGFLRSAALTDVPHFATAFRQGLKETGFSEGQNVAVEYHSADDHHDRLVTLAADLVRRPVDVIVANHNAALAAKAVTTSVPIVFSTGSDPVRDGLVASLNRPGGNITGVVNFSSVLGGKRLELLRKLVPEATTIGVLVYPGGANTEAERRDVQAAAQATNQQLIILDISSEGDFEIAFATLVQRGARALLLGAGAFMNSNRKRVVALAARYRLPTSYAAREAVLDNGLMSYGSSFTMPIAKSASIPGKFLEARNLPSCRSCSPSRLNCSQPQDCQDTGLPVPPRYSASPTR